MKVEGRIFALGAAFFFIVAAIYWYFARDPIGTTALTLCGGLALLVAFYVLYTAKRHHGGRDQTPRHSTGAGTRGGGAVL